MHRLALLVTGASGMLLPRHLLALLARHPGVGRVHLVVSRGAAQVLSHELGRDRTGGDALLDAAGRELGDLDATARAKVEIHRDSDLDAAIASGSYRLDGTIVMPCSASTLGALAVGTGTTLVHRAGAVALKEGWPLVLGFRETPYSILHIENMRRLAQAGAVLLPPTPAFYIGGEEMGRFLDHYALRVLDRVGLRETEGSELRWPDAGLLK